MPETKTKVYSLSLPSGWQSAPEIRVLKSGDNGPLFVLAYLSLLEASAPHSGLLVFDNGFAYTEPMIPSLVGFGLDKEGADLASALVASLEGLGLMAKDEQGRLYLPKAGEATRGELKSSIAKRNRRNENPPQIPDGSEKGRTQDGQKTDTGRTKDGQKTDKGRTKDGQKTDTEKEPPNVSLNGPLGNSLSLSKDKESSIPPHSPEKSLSEIVHFGEMSTKKGSDLPEDLRAKANETAKWYPKKSLGIIDSVYGWFYENKPTDEDMASIRRYFQLCMASPEWKDRIAQDPGFRYLPSIINFLNTWISWKGIAEADPGNQKAAEEKALEESVNSNPSAFISSFELMKREYEGNADDGDLAELESRRDRGSITERERSDFEAYRQEREAIKRKPPSAQRPASGGDGGFVTMSAMLGGAVK